MTLIGFFNRRWVENRWLWLQRLHCTLSRGKHLCRYCVTVGCAWCRTKIIRVIDARKPESGWKYSAEKGWACPACHEAITTALNWEPVKPTDDYES